MEFTLSGNKFNLNPKDVLNKMQGVPPEIIRTHAVNLNGKLYPVKQVVSIITNLSKADFNSHQAHQILKRLGLQVVAMNNIATS